MAKKTWHVNLNGKNHTVHLSHNYWTSKREVTVDGKRIALPQGEKRPLIDFGSDINFKLGEHHATIVIRTNAITYSYDLLIEGISKTTGEKATYLDNKKYNLFWGEIKDKQMATLILRDTALVASIAVGLSAVVSSLLGDFIGWIDFVIVALLSLWMYKKQSVLASSLLIAVIGAELIITIYKNFQINGGIGTNIYLATIIFYLSLRSFQAILLLRDDAESAEQL